MSPQPGRQCQHAEIGSRGEKLNRSTAGQQQEGPIIAKRHRFGNTGCGPLDAGGDDGRVRETVEDLNRARVIQCGGRARRAEDNTLRPCGEAIENQLDGGAGSNLEQMAVGRPHQSRVLARGYLSRRHRKPEVQRLPDG